MNARILFFAIFFLLVSCCWSRSPLPILFIYYPPNPPACAPWVIVEGRLPRDAQHHFVSVIRYYPDELHGVYTEVVGTIDPTIQSIRFRLTEPTNAPSRDEALTTLPPASGWKGTYELTVFAEKSLPEFGIQCTPDSAPVVIKSDPRIEIIVIAEDPASPGGLKVIKHPSPGWY